MRALSSSSRPQIRTEELSVLICASGVRKQNTEDMCFHMRLDMAWLHSFTLEIAHPPNQRDVSTTATRTSLLDAQFSKSKRIAMTCFLSVRMHVLQDLLDCHVSAFAPKPLTRRGVPSAFHLKQKSSVPRHSEDELYFGRTAQRNVSHLRPGSRSRSFQQLAQPGTLPLVCGYS